MRIVLQRVSRGEVRIDGTVSGRIGRGYVVLVGFGPDDNEETLEWMADKVVGLRLFADDDERMNLDLDTGVAPASSTPPTRAWPAGCTNGSSSSSGSACPAGSRAASSAQ